MEIYLKDESAYHYVPRFTFEVAHDRIEQKKSSLVAGAVSSLVSRPNPNDIQMVAFESRLEPFWLVNARLRTVYDRNRTYSVPLGGPEV